MVTEIPVYRIICGACGHNNETANYWITSYRCSHCGAQNDVKRPEQIIEPSNTVLKTK